jgi:hypothetical protein
LARAGGKSHSFWAALPPCLRAVAPAARISALCGALLLAGCSLPLQAETSATADTHTASEETVPVVQPYVLPTFTGAEPAINNHIAAYIPAPKINADTLFKNVLACYPHKSKWKIDVELRAALSASDPSFDSSASTSTLGDNYAQIVASMPLYSATELDRAMKNEHDLRQETAKTVAQLVKAIAARNHALRKIALYTSLEQRSSVRVQGGVVGATEQVGYLEKVAKAYEDEIEAETDIITARLALAALCAGDQYEAMNSYLAQLSAAPQAAAPAN